MMDAFYRLLLGLYPPAYQREYGEEMASVFLDASEGVRGSGWTRIAFFAREASGLLCGALREHFRFAGLAPANFGRFTMRSGFRFPRSTTGLMIVILAGVILAIDKARDIAESLPRTSPQLPAIHPAAPTFVQAIVVMFAITYISAIVAWVVLHAMRRSGVHRLSDLEGEARGN
jgi:hypothetical protein